MARIKSISIINIREWIMTLYDLLEIPPSSSPAEIEKAWKKMALKYHTDKNTNIDPGRIKLINNAHDILKDPNQRAEYDRSIGITYRTYNTETHHKKESYQQKEDNCWHEEETRKREEKARKEQEQKEAEERIYNDPDNDFTTASYDIKEKVRKTRSKYSWVHSPWGNRARESELSPKIRKFIDVSLFYVKPPKFFNEDLIENPFSFRHYLNIRPYKSYKLPGREFLSDLFVVPVLGLMKTVLSIVFCFITGLHILAWPPALFLIPYKFLSNKSFCEQENMILFGLKITFSFFVQGSLELLSSPFNILARLFQTLRHGGIKKFEESHLIQEARELAIKSLDTEDKFSLNIALAALHKKCDRSEEKGRFIPFKMMSERLKFYEIEEEMVLGTLNSASTKPISSHQKTLINEYLNFFKTKTVIERRSERSSFSASTPK